MASSKLSEFLAENPPAEQFTPYSLLNENSDALTVFLKPDAEYSKRLNDHVTLLLSLDDDSIVGCRIKGIQNILDDLPNYVKINHSGVEVSILFLPFLGSADPAARTSLNTLARETSEKNLRLQLV
jgi:hypothetical protein